MYKYNRLKKVALDRKQQNAAWKDRKRLSLAHKIQAIWNALHMYSSNIAALVEAIHNIIIHVHIYYSR